MLSIDCNYTIRKVPTFHELISNSWPVSSGWGWFDVPLESKSYCLTGFSEKPRQCGYPDSKCKGLGLLAVTCCEISERNHESFCWCDRLPWSAWLLQYERLSKCRQMLDTLWRHSCERKFENGPALYAELYSFWNECLSHHTTPRSAKLISKFLSEVKFSITQSKLLHKRMLHSKLFAFFKYFTNPKSTFPSCFSFPSWP